MRGEKQYNMVESDDYQDPVPPRAGVQSFMAKHVGRRPEMLAHCDGVLVDLQGSRLPHLHLPHVAFLHDGRMREAKKILVGA